MIKRATEPEHRGWVRFALTGSTAAWVVAFLEMSLSTSGAVSLSAAFGLLAIGWVGAVVLTYFAEALWDIPAKYRVALTLVTAVLLGSVLGGAALFEFTHGPSSARALRPPSSNVASGLPASQPSNTTIATPTAHPRPTSQPHRTATPKAASSSPSNLPSPQPSVTCGVAGGNNYGNQTFNCSDP